MHLHKRTDRPVFYFAGQPQDNFYRPCWENASRGTWNGTADWDGKGLPCSMEELQVGVLQRIATALEAIAKITTEHDRQQRQAIYDADPKNIAWKKWWGESQHAVSELRAKISKCYRGYGSKIYPDQLAHRIFDKWFPARKSDKSRPSFDEMMAFVTELDPATFDFSPFCTALILGRIEECRKKKASEQ